MKYKEIADKRGLKINTVRSRIHSAKKVIKNLWIEKKRKNSNKTINILGVTILQLLGDDEKPAKINHRNLSNVSIIKANYGAGNAWLDVSEKVSQLVEDKKEVKSSNRLAGDPCYGSSKVLTIEYICEGKTFTVEIKEGKTFLI
jgi:hypothetical protein